MIWVVVPMMAWGQAPPAEEGPTFTFNQVLVTTIQALDAPLQEEADRLHADLTARFRASHDVIAMDDVLGFQVHDYGPDVYMRGCPPGEYAGCALVLGQRALADWVVGGTLAQEIGTLDAPFVLNVHVIDVTDAREVTAFTVPLAPDRDAAMNGIVDLFSDVLDGAMQIRDMRMTPDADEAAIEAARRQLMAGYLEELETELGQVIPSKEIAPVEATKVTRDELEQFDDEADSAPWDRVGMGQREFLRFSNSGKELEAWRVEGRGRTGELVLRLVGGFGGGPWHQDYAGQVLLSGTDLEPVHTAQFLEVVNGSTATAELEVGIGVLPVLELSVLGGVHTGRTTLIRDEDVEGQPSIPGTPAAASINTYHYGFRATLAPMVHSRARPTVATGVSLWAGAGVPGISNFPRIDAPTLVVLHVLPGGEFEASPIVTLFARGGIDLTLGGTPSRAIDIGEGLTDPPVPGGRGGPGWILQTGLQVHVGPLFRTQ